MEINDQNAMISLIKNLTTLLPVNDEYLFLDSTRSQQTQQKKTLYITII